MKNLPIILVMPEQHCRLKCDIGENKLIKIEISRRKMKRIIITFFSYGMNKNLLKF